MGPLNDLNVDSLAFRQAVLASERRRIYGVTAFLLAFAAGMAFRIIVFRSHMSPWGIVFLLLVVGYEAWMLTAVKRALQNGHDIPRVMWASNLLLETVAPALGVAHFSSPLLGEYRAIGTPWVLAFFPLILLSVLRLDPRVSHLAGAVAAIGYLVAALIVGWRPQHPQSQPAFTGANCGCLLRTDLAGDRISCCSGQQRNYQACESRSARGRDDTPA